MSHWDVLVIGAGPGGYVAAIRARQLGLNAACVEKERLGGVCLNWGCIPSKALLRAAEHYRFLTGEAEAFGLSVQGAGYDYAKVIQRSRRIADQSERGVQFLFKKYGVTSIKGTATLTGPGRVRVGDEEHTATHLILATGARAKVLPGMEPDGERILTYREAVAATTQPESVVILGAGAIGCEFAYFWASFGTRVTLVEAADRIVPLEDEEVSAELARAFRKQDIEVRTGTKCAGVRREGEGVVVALADGTELRASHCLLALGVTPNTEGLGLEGLGVKLGRGGFVEHDPSFRTSVPGIYAIGDVCGPPALAHTAYAEAHVCVDRIAGRHTPDVDYGNMPSCTYCQPQVASVGLTEAQARAAGKDVVVGRFPFSANGKARALGTSAGFCKVVIDRAHGEILGAHLVGHDASELLPNFVMARGAEVTARHFLHTVHAHPTLGEAMVEAVAVALGECAHL